MNNATWIAGVAGIVAVSAIGIGYFETQRTTTNADGQEVVKIGPFEVTGKSPERKDKVVKTDAEWKELLAPEQYEILRAKGTEPMFCEAGIGKDGPGVYHCVGCDLPLFKSGSKFESGSGWPAFFEPYKNENIWMKMDRGFGMVRVEVLCSRCDGHLGHVFEDGPKDKTGVRFCINSKVIKFKKS